MSDFIKQLTQLFEGYKHQSKSFRTINGERYVCWTDTNPRTHKEDNINTQRHVDFLKSKGVKIHKSRVGNGMIRIFGRESDMKNAGLIKEPSSEIS